MERVLSRIFWAEATFGELKDEAARLDRSVSWLVQLAWKAQRTRAAAMTAGGPEVAAIREQSAGRHPLRLASLQLNARLFEQRDPAAQPPKGMDTSPVFLARELFEELDVLGERLGLASWELLEWAWRESRALVAAEVRPED